MEPPADIHAFLYSEAIAGLVSNRLLALAQFLWFLERCVPSRTSGMGSRTSERCRGIDITSYRMLRLVCQLVVTSAAFSALCRSGMNLGGEMRRTVHVTLRVGLPPRMARDD